VFWISFVVAASHVRACIVLYELCCEIKLGRARMSATSQRGRQARCPVQDVFCPHARSGSRSRSAPPDTARATARPRPPSAHVPERSRPSIHLFPAPPASSTACQTNAQATCVPPPIHSVSTADDGDATSFYGTTLARSWLAVS
jgi:hypothetical protein